MFGPDLDYVTITKKATSHKIVFLLLVFPITQTITYIFLTNDIDNEFTDKKKINFV